MKFEVMRTDIPQLFAQLCYLDLSDMVFGVSLSLSFPFFSWLRFISKNDDVLEILTMHNSSEVMSLKLFPNISHHLLDLSIISKRI